MVNFNVLKDTDLTLAMSCCASPEAVLYVAKENEIVKNLKKELASTVDFENEFVAFIEALQGDFKTGYYNDADATFCALCAVVEDSQDDPIVNKFLRDLSKLEIQEYPMSPKVADLVFQGEVG